MKKRETSKNRENQVKKYGLKVIISNCAIKSSKMGFHTTSYRSNFRVKLESRLDVKSRHLKKVHMMTQNLWKLSLKNKMGSSGLKKRH